MNYINKHFFVIFLGLMCILFLTFPGFVLSSESNRNWNEMLNSYVCNNNYISVSGDCLHGETYCKDRYGEYSIFKNSKCSCQKKYGFDLNKTICELSDYYTTYSNEINEDNFANDEVVLNEQYKQFNPIGLLTESLIKSEYYAEVFYVNADLCLRWIVSEEAAEKHFGANWNSPGFIMVFDNIPPGYTFCENVE